MKTGTDLSLAVLFAIGILVAAAGEARADGVLMTPPGYYLWERQQNAVLRLEDGVEDLQIAPTFAGDAHDFAWIVPVPDLPEVTTADIELFQQAAVLTRPVDKYRDSNWGCTDERYYDAVSQPGVTVLSDELVGSYRTLVIAASDATVLADSLTAWGYLTASNQDTVLPVLASYISREWVFVAMKVDESALDEEIPYLPGYWYGGMQPVRLRFPARQLIYPMYISALSTNVSVAVNLYTIGEHRMTHPTLDTWYANRISGSELAAIRARYPAVGYELEEGDFLTRLSSPYYSVALMDTDLVLEPADNDDELRLVNYAGLPVWNLFLAGSMIAWLVLRRRRRMRRIPNGIDGV